MARAWASLDPKPKRSAYFASVTAEESWAARFPLPGRHRPVPAGRIAADLNFDSFSPLGRTRDAGFSGAERTTLWGLVQKTAQDFGLTLKGDTHPDAGGYYRSDHFLSPGPACPPSPSAWAASTPTSLPPTPPRR